MIEILRIGWGHYMRSKTPWNEDEIKRIFVFPCLKECGWDDCQLREEWGNSSKTDIVLMASDQREFPMAKVEVKKEQKRGQSLEWHGIPDLISKNEVVIPIGYSTNGKLIVEVILEKCLYRKVPRYLSPQEMFTKHRLSYHEIMKNMVLSVGEIDERIAAAIGFVEIIKDLKLDYAENVMILSQRKDTRSIAENIIKDARCHLLENARGVFLEKWNLDKSEIDNLIKAERLTRDTHYCEALEIFQEISESHRQAEYPYAGIIASLNGLGNFEEANRVADRLFNITINYHEWLLVLAEECLHWRQATFARYYLNQLPEKVAESSSWALRTFGRVFAQEGYHDDAIGLLNESRSIYNHEDVLWDIAESHTRLGELAEAYEIYQRFLKENPNMVEASVNSHIIAEIMKYH